MTKVDLEIDCTAASSDLGEGCLVLVIFGAVVVALITGLVALGNMIGATS